MGFDSGKGFSGGGSGGGGTYSIVGVVANYSALPSPASATNKFYWVENSQGTAWLPFSLGGTYYSNGLYYSNGVSWEYMDVPYQATQLEVNTGTNNDKFVTPATLKNLNGSFNRKIYNYQNTDSSVTGTTNQTVTANLLVSGGSMGVNGVLELKSKIAKTTVGTGSVTARYYLSTDATNTIGTTGTPTNSTLIGTVISGTQTNSFTPFIRSLVNKNSESLNDILLVTNNAVSDETVNIGTAISTLNIDTSIDLYLVETLQLSSSVDTAILKSLQIYINKP